MTSPAANEKPHRGLLITFEGPEGSGKTTLIQAVSEALARRGCESLMLREPGGTPIGERIRAILLDLSSRGMTAECELLLMEASRAQLVREKIAPALEAGLIVLCDRFATGGLQPDLTFLCLLPPAEGRARLKQRKTDRLDREDLEFHERVYEGYQALAATGQPRLAVLDASQSPDAMFEDAMEHLARLEHGLLKFL